jgi:non-lysosomal glucosylceramidase
MGCLIKLYRDWQLSGDEQMLRQLWPKARAAMAYCWIEGGWDGDRDGMMEGCQHNTMDVEYFGPNPHMSVLYLAALRAMQEMASHLGDEEFARTCSELFNSGRRKIDAELFNDEYYQQQVRPIPDPAKIAPGLRMLPDHHLPDPPMQIGPGCEMNQLFGQQLANVAGLGPLLQRRNMRTALKAMMEHNFRNGFGDFFNHLRTYALNDESGMLMCTWPRGGRPTRPFPYAKEVWTGLEYMVAAHLLDEGMGRDALRLVSAARGRHDGLRRNPFNEFECGNHYARAMSSWAVLLSATGFRYSAVDQSMVMKRLPGEVFWSTGYAWGTCRVKGSSARINVLGGSLSLRRLTIGAAAAELRKPVTLHAHTSRTIRLSRSAAVHAT